MNTERQLARSGGLTAAPLAPPEADRLADSPTAAAARLGISVPTFYREVRAGRIELLKARGRSLCTREAQAKWLASLAAKA